MGIFSHKNVMSHHIPVTGFSNCQDLPHSLLRARPLLCFKARPNPQVWRLPGIASVSSALKWPSGPGSLTGSFSHCFSRIWMQTRAPGLRWFGLCSLLLNAILPVFLFTSLLLNS